MSSLAIDWRWVGEHALLGTVATADLATAVGGALALHRRLRELDRPEVVELVPAAASVLVLLAGGAPEVTRAGAAISAIGAVDPSATGPAREAPEYSIEVTYGGADGPDLGAVAEICNLTESTVVARHAAARYTVAFVGFSPGFPYLVGLPPELAVPRLASPRPRVPAGTVAIAGPFAAVYPQATPGGWRLIGRAALDPPLFDPAAENPARLVAGDRVRFVAR